MTREIPTALNTAESSQGAGGIGGILARVDNDTGAVHSYLYDGNGNVGELVDSSSGLVAAAYEYAPFGGLISSRGSYAVVNPYRFSTKPLDAVTGWYYYGRRPYDPKLGRWPTRDPIAEQGGLNLYAFVGNEPVGRWDYLGLSSLFEKLWNNHPTITGENFPCSTDGKPNFGNQCAIRIGVALTATGTNLSKTCTATFCWHHNKSAGHVIRAEELANFLATHSVKGVDQRQKKTPVKNYAKILSGKTGIIFFKDYWQRSGESTQNGSGDHIDLWNGSRLTDRRSWFRIHLNIGRFGAHNLGAGSDFRCAKEIWFWNVK